jgi:hypothetical protein
MTLLKLKSSNMKWTGRIIHLEFFKGTARISDYKGFHDRIIYNELGRAWKKEVIA